MNQNANYSLTSVFLTSAVFAAVITSITNLIISVANGKRLKKIEKQKIKNEWDKFRYSKLYDLIQNWHSYDSDSIGDSVSEIATSRLVNLFLDNKDRYEIVKPLLDDSYKPMLDSLLKQGEEKLLNLVDKKESGDYKALFSEYTNIGGLFSDSLRKAIYDQIRKLMES